MKDWDQHWKRSLVDAQNRAGLTEFVPANFNTMDDVFNELMQLKLELKKTKELAKNRPTMIITRTEPLPQPEVAASIRRAPSTVSKILSMGKKMGGKTLRSMRSPSHAQVTP